VRLPNGRHASLLARVETKRRIRVLLRSRLQAGALAITALFMLVATAGLSFAAYSVGERVATEGVAEYVRYGRLGASALFLVGTALTGLRVVGEQGELDHEAGILTTIPHRDAVFGLLLAELVGLAAYVTIPLVCLSVAVALGSGSAALGAAVLVTAATTLVLGLFAGQAFGYVLRYGFVASRLLARYKTALAVLVFLAYMYVVTVSQDASFAIPLLEAVGATPIGWVGLLPFAVIGDASLVEALAGVAVSAAVLPILLGVATLAAGAAWYADEPTGERETTTHESTTIDAGPLERAVGRPSAWVARTAWTRAYRAPMKLVFVLYPAFVLVTPVVEAVRTGVVAPSLPVIFAVYGAWAAGAGFALNLLGDEGAMLPVTLTSGVSGTAFVRGIVSAAAVAGAPVVVPLAVGAGLLVPFPPVQLVLLALSTVALLVGAGMLATGIGTALPRFESVRISRSRRVVAPSLFAFGVYSFVLVVVASPGLATQVPFVADALADQLGVSATALRAGGTVATAVLVGVCGYVSYRSAAKKVDDWTL